MFHFHKNDEGRQFVSIRPSDPAHTLPIRRKLVDTYGVHTMADDDEIIFEILSGVDYHGSGSDYDRAIREVDPEAVRQTIAVNGAGRRTIIKN